MIINRRLIGAIFFLSVLLAPLLCYPALKTFINEFNSVLRIIKIRRNPTIPATLIQFDNDQIWLGVTAGIVGHSMSHQKLKAAPGPSGSPGYEYGI